MGAIKQSYQLQRRKNFFDKKSSSSEFTSFGEENSEYSELNRTSLEAGLRLSVEEYLCKISPKNENFEKKPNKKRASFSYKKSPFSELAGSKRSTDLTNSGSQYQLIPKKISKEFETEFLNFYEKNKNSETRVLSIYEEMNKVSKDSE